MGQSFESGKVVMKCAGVQSGPPRLRQPSGTEEEAGRVPAGSHPAPLLEGRPPLGTPAGSAAAQRDASPTATPEVTAESTQPPGLTHHVGYEQSVCTESVSVGFGE
ncbi:hypothetical protein H1C71_015360 [Ictidomys tridecemlineatus]|nr:hypothetical protein H1C71_015360 [Ictidomys tridecemlineatus]